MSMAFLMFHATRKGNARKRMSTTICGRAYCRGKPWKMVSWYTI